MVWEIDPGKRTVVVYASVTQSLTLLATDTLDGGRLLRGFTILLSELVAELDRRG